MEICEVVDNRDVYVVYVVDNRDVYVVYNSCNIYLETSYLII